MAREKTQRQVGEHLEKLMLDRTPDGIKFCYIEITNYQSQGFNVEKFEPENTRLMKFISDSNKDGFLKDN